MGGRKEGRVPGMVYSELGSVSESKTKACKDVMGICTGGGGTYCLSTRCRTVKLGLWGD